jgi:hypothetical protein
MTVTRYIALSIFAAATGCGAFDSVPSGAVTQCETDAIVPGAVQTDILFVVDDSGSMQVEQDNLAANFQSFIDDLSSSAAKNDFQIGITTTSVDRNTSSGGVVTVSSTFAASTNECAAGHPNTDNSYPAGALVAVDATGRQIESGAGRILASGSPTLAQDFIRNVHVGVCGSGKEQGLRAAKLALSEPLLSGANAGFLRPHAKLAVIVVSDDDDCSDPGDGQGHPLVQPGQEGTTCEQHAESVSDYVQFLQGPIGGEVRDVVVAAIASVDPGTLQPAVCTVPSGGTSEFAATRYADIVQRLGSKATIASICSASFADALKQIAGLIASQTVPLSGTPADPSLLAATVTRAGGATTSCPVAVEGADTPDTGAIYTPPDTQQGRSASLTFRGPCTLGQGDEVHIQQLCAR